MQDELLRSRTVGRVNPLTDLSRSYLICLSRGAVGEGGGGGGPRYMRHAGNAEHYGRVPGRPPGHLFPRLVSPLVPPVQSSFMRRAYGVSENEIDPFVVPRDNFESK